MGQEEYAGVYDSETMITQRSRSALFVQTVALMPSPRPKRVRVDARVTLARTKRAYIQTNADEPYGPTGAVGVMHLRVNSPSSLGGPVTAQRVFLRHFETHIDPHFYDDSNFQLADLTLTTEITLPPGATELHVTITAMIHAFVPGLTSSPRAAFVGVDFRAPQTRNVWPFGPAGDAVAGPVQVPGFTVTEWTSS